MLQPKNIFAVSNTMGKKIWVIADNAEHACDVARDVSHVYKPDNAKAEVVISPEEALGGDCAQFAERGISGVLVEHDRMHDRWILQVGKKKNYRYLVMVNGQEKRCTDVEDARMLLSLMPTKEELDSVTDVTVSREPRYGHTVQVARASGGTVVGTYLSEHPHEDGVHLILLDDDATTIKATTESIKVVISVEELALNVIRHARINCRFGSDLDACILRELQASNLLVDEL